jgi:bisphosphoglycerate-dependent phosphoglycerate mutase
LPSPQFIQVRKHSNKMAKLFLVRHGESEWNERGVWTGWTEVNLTEKGIEQAQKAGNVLKDEKIDKIYVSDMDRAKQTMEEIKNVCGPNLECIATRHTRYQRKKLWYLHRQKQMGDQRADRRRSFH